MNDTSTAPLALIVIEDSADDYALLLARLTRHERRVEALRVETRFALEHALAQRAWDAVISDHRLPHFTSLEALAVVRAHDPELPFLIVSGAIGEEAAVEAMRAGADDYLMKDKLGRLEPALARALEGAAAKRRQRAAEQALRNSREELRTLATHLTRVREQEREAIAREIHDDVGGTLTAIKFELAFLRNAHKGNGRLAAPLARVGELIDSAILASTRIMHDLRPGILDEGVVAALEWQARSFEQRMGIACRFASSHSEIPLAPEQAIGVFRICQEALNNVAKHAAARAVDIRLRAGAGRLVMDIGDDGKGVESADLDHPDRFGLRGMRERAHSLGGAVDIRGVPGRGTTISVSLPLARPPTAVPVAAANGEHSP